MQESEGKEIQPIDGNTALLRQVMHNLNELFMDYDITPVSIGFDIKVENLDDYMRIKVYDYNGKMIRDYFWLVDMTDRDGIIHIMKDVAYELLVYYRVI